jgi:hypothetical protein
MAQPQGLADSEARLPPPREGDHALIGQTGDSNKLTLCITVRRLTVCLLYLGLLCGATHRACWVTYVKLGTAHATAHNGAGG